MVEKQMELLERFTTGDVEAFEMLFQQYQKDVFGWIVRIVRNPTVAEELTVETFWRVYRSHARFNPTRSFGAWTRRIAMTVVTNSSAKSLEMRLNRLASGSYKRICGIR